MNESLVAMKPRAYLLWFYSGLIARGRVHIFINFICLFRLNAFPSLIPPHSLPFEMLHFSAAILLFSLTSSIANAAPWRALGDHTTPTVGRAATAVQVINDGTSFQTGTSTPGTPGLGWQASGYVDRSPR